MFKKLDEWKNLAIFGTAIRNSTPPGQYAATAEHCFFVI